jgi:hypothetical protein
MRMSDHFPLPLHADIPAGETLAFRTTGAAAEAAVHAVNHHDALVDRVAVLELALSNAGANFLSPDIVLQVCSEALNNDK